MDVDVAVPPAGVDHALSTVPSDLLVEGELGALDQPLADTLVHKSSLSVFILIDNVY